MVSTGLQGGVEGSQSFHFRGMFEYAENLEGKSRDRIYWMDFCLFGCVSKLRPCLFTVNEFSVSAVLIDWLRIKFILY